MTPLQARFQATVLSQVTTARRLPTFRRCGVCGVPSNRHPRCPECRFPVGAGHPDELAPDGKLCRSCAGLDTMRKDQPVQTDLPDDGYALLAATILRDALLHEKQWLWRERGAVAFWCDVAGLEPSLFYQRLQAVG